MVEISAVQKRAEGKSKFARGQISESIEFYESFLATNEELS